MTKKVHDQVEVFEHALTNSEAKTYVLRLYVAGATPKSTQSIVNIKRICEEYLKGRYVVRSLRGQAVVLSIRKLLVAQRE